MDSRLRGNDKRAGFPPALPAFSEAGIRGDDKWAGFPPALPAFSEAGIRGNDKWITATLPNCLTVI